MLVTTALVTDSDVAIVVATSILLLGFQQRSFRTALVQVLVNNLDDAALARSRRRL